MAIQKRKAVGTGASQLVKRAKAAQASKKQKEDDERADEQAEVEEEEEAEDDEEEELKDEAEDQENEEEVLKRREEEIAAARKKELRGMPVGEIKTLASKASLETGNKLDMIETILTYEAGVRAAERAHEAKIRDVLIKKKDELEALSMQELKTLCVAAGSKAMMTKKARVELLITQWQEQDGVQTAMAKMVRDAREEELRSKDNAQLRKLCTNVRVDAFVKELMVERIVKHEGTLGLFARPTLDVSDDEEVPSKSAKKSNMVDVLLANEANRKKEKEQKRKEEEAAASKRKGFRAMSVDELKKILISKGNDPAGKKKDDMVELLFDISVQEDEVAAKKARLKALSLEELKQRIIRKGLDAGKKEAMIESLLAHEAKMRKDAQAFEGHVSEVLEKKKKEFEEKTAADLKELCASKGLKLGSGKPDRVATLLEDTKSSGEVDKIIASMLKEARRVSLLAMDKEAVLKICEACGADPTVKEVMVERLLAHEDEFGRAVEDERPAKRPRTSKH